MLYDRRGLSLLLADMLDMPEYGLASVMDDARDYLCPHCGEIYFGSTALRGHLGSEVGRLRRSEGLRPLTGLESAVLASGRQGRRSMRQLSEARQRVAVVGTKGSEGS